MPMSNREMSLLVEDLVNNPHKIAINLKEKRWDRLEALASFLKNFPKLVLPLAQTDPVRFKKLMYGITQCYILGWNNLNQEKIKLLKSKKND